MPASPRPAAIGVAALASFALVYGGLSTCQGECPEDCGPSVQITWEPGVLPEADLVEVCIGRECTTVSPDVDATESGSAEVAGVLPRRHSEFEIFLGLYK